MEAFASMTRFILTCNYLTKITGPIQSRCQTGLFHFSAMPEEEMAGVLKRILGLEKIGFDEADVEKHVKMCFPDLRRTISLAQRAVRSGRFVFVDETETRKAILALILARDLKGIRKMLAEGRGGDYSDLYRYVYDNVDVFDQKVRLQVLLDAAEYMWRDSSVADKEMNFAAFCAKTMRVLG
jgi:DNA polymerase III delta prime subunit